LQKPQAINIAITTVLPEPVAILQQSRVSARRSGLDGRSHRVGWKSVVPASRLGFLPANRWRISASLRAKFWKRVR